ncbi:hypothetical protein QEG98_10470 [Myxococcus sp. MxC21-1]|uniref:hypothetical protein n=1 Tax=Myxococcus sp. MxC21-1 TaxID=3041439 RepID=UPI00292E8BCF|nr:hypothetical protein [Myxococcus sp. MxC21-1]WNZ64061.1 hypothetical protein QEG98_10470 [Myxococcus sp. MxC21-1]
MELTTQTRFTPSEGGWLLAQAVPRSRLTRNGQEVPTGVADVLARFTLQAWLAADGTFVKLVAPEAAQEALRRWRPRARRRACWSASSNPRPWRRGRGASGR